MTTIVRDLYQTLAAGLRGPKGDEMPDQGPTKPETRAELREDRYQRLTAAAAAMRGETPPTTDQTKQGGDPDPATQQQENTPA